MNPTKEMCRLALTTDYSNRRIARVLHVAPNTVRRCRTRLQELGLDWAQVRTLDDGTLILRLNPGKSRGRQFTEPDWSIVQRELATKGVTLEILWAEYASATPQPATMSYREFCRRYRRYRGRYGVVMRQQHKAGEKLFCDFAGKRPSWVDAAAGGVIVYDELFVACLGLSNYTYAEAIPSQSTADFIEAHVRAFEFLGGVTEFIVPDNLKAAVISRSKGEIRINPEFQLMAEHYDSCIDPARVGHPQDKAKVEIAVKLMTRMITAILRKRVFFSRADLNAAIREAVNSLNARPFRRAPEDSRLALFERLDRPALKPLPPTRYEHVEYHPEASVARDYHFRFDGSHYSVPHQHGGEKIEVRATQRVVEAWRNGVRVATHARSAIKGAFVTDRAHLKDDHRRWQDHVDNPAAWADGRGTAVRRVVQLTVESGYKPKQILGAMERLARRVGAQRFEAACAYALRINTVSFTSLKSILDTGLDRRSDGAAADGVLQTPPEHDNIRGADYYRGPPSEQRREPGADLDAGGPA